MTLQDHHRLNADMIHTKFRQWVSNKLKADRQYNSRKRSTKHQQGNDKENKRRNVHMSDNNSDFDSDDSAVSGTPVTARKVRRLTLHFTSDEDTDVPTSLPVIDNEPRPLETLISLLESSRYQLKHTRESANEVQPTAVQLYTWDEIRTEMRWPDAMLCTVMTPETYVTVHGKDSRIAITQFNVCNYDLLECNVN